MTAAMILETRERTESRRLTVVRPEPEVIRLAREGDAASLAEILDMTSDAVYAYAFAATHKSRVAVQVTEAVLARLPRVIRRQRWDSIEALSASLMGIARTEVATWQRRSARRGSQQDVRALTRHVILAATSVATIVYAGILAF